jgi:hypothetical protein
MLFQGKKITCIINYNEKKYSFDLEKHKTINDLYNIFIEKVANKNYPYVIMHISNKNNMVEITNLETALLSLGRNKNEQLLFKFIKSFKCPSCQTVCDNEKKFINNYCLECNQYICSICSKDDSKHSKHYLVNIDQNNLKDSIKLWNINLNADLSNQITFFNRQLNFVNQTESDIKTNLWLDNIYKKIKYFENLLADIKSKCQELKSIFKESEDMLSKAMNNLTKSEQEVNIDLFSKEKIINKFFSFTDAEKQIQKLKTNYIEIKDVKRKVCLILDANNIKKYDELLFEVPRVLDDLSKTSFLILEDLKTYEEKNNKPEKIIFRDRSRKNTDIIINSHKLFKTSKDTALSLNKMRNRNLYLFDKDRKRTDIITNYSNKSEEIFDNKTGSSRKNIFNYNKVLNTVENSRYTPNDIKLPKIILNDKEKNNITNLKYNNDNKKMTLELHKSSNLLKKNNK